MKTQVFNHLVSLLVTTKVLTCIDILAKGFVSVRKYV